MSDGVSLIAAERKRHVEEEGWTAEHDARHVAGEIAIAAAVYALPEVERRELPYYDPQYGGDGSPLLWPWPGWYKPRRDDRVCELVKAGALIAAEIDRLLSVGESQDEESS